MRRTIVYMLLSVVGFVNCVIPGIPCSSPGYLDFSAGRDSVVKSRHVGKHVAGLESAVRAWLKKANEREREIEEQGAYIRWDFFTNLTEFNSERLTNISTAYSEWSKQRARRARWFMKQPGRLTRDTRRQLRLMSKDANLADSDDVRRESELLNKMTNIYSTATVRKEDRTLPLDPDLRHTMSNSRDPRELYWVWKNWRNVTGRLIRPIYSEFISLINKGARENGYEDYGAYWRDVMFDQTPDLQRVSTELWEDLKPMYDQLHAYVRRKIHNFYRKGYPSMPLIREGKIPAHLLGDMWALVWQDIYDIVEPFPGVNDQNVTAALLRQRYTVNRMVRTADEFFTSTGMFPMREEFWNNSMFERPSDREVLCHPFASEFFNGRDYRIKMCITANEDNFSFIHHEIGHLQYSMAYSRQPMIYRDGANCGFHEAVGDTISLSVNNPTHLDAIGLIPRKSGARSKQEEYDAEINFLMKMALQKIAYLPFAYMLDTWRWAVFSGEIRKEEYNQKYWELREKYQGIYPPVGRTEQDFDPGSILHIAVNVPYMCYFYADVYQFQFFEALCAISNHKGPLHRCDYYRSKEAGQRFIEMLRLGQSRPWPEALHLLTGERRSSARAMKKYFRPLMDWLKLHNQNETIGWKGNIQL